MIKINDAKITQKEEISKFLSESFNQNITSYQNIFRYYKLFNEKYSDSPPPGFTLTKNKKLIGFLGLLSHKIQNKKNLWALNMTSWIVNESSRGAGLQLIQKLMKFKNCIITNFSANDNVEKILLNLDFKEIDDSEFILKTYQYFINGITNSKNYLVGKKAIEIIKNKSQQKILSDHFSMGCKVFSIFYEKETIGLIFLNCGEFSQFIYASNTNYIMSKKFWYKICFILLVHFKIKKIRVDSRFIHSALGKKINKKKTFIYAKNFNPKTIFRIYSEPIHKYGEFK